MKYISYRSGGGPGREKIVMTPVTPEQAGRREEVRREERGDPSWSVVVGTPRPPPRPSVVGPTLICLFLLLSYITCSALLVARIQAWAFFDAFYFCFMALLTVGQGSLPPSQASLRWYILHILFIQATQIL